MKHFVILTLLLLCASTVFADDEPDGNTLLRDCKSVVHYLNSEPFHTDDLFPSGYCFGAIHGVSDLAQAWEVIDLPTNSTLAQEVRVIVAFLERHPESLNKRDTLLILTALREAFPKRNSKEKTQ
jgi:hypothetical protein